MPVETTADGYVCVCSWCSSRGPTRPTIDEAIRLSGHVVSNLSGRSHTCETCRVSQESVLALYLQQQNLQILHTPLSRYLDYLDYNETFPIQQMPSGAQPYEGVNPVEIQTFTIEKEFQMDVEDKPKSIWERLNEEDS